MFFSFDLATPKSRSMDPVKKLSGREREESFCVCVSIRKETGCVCVCVWQLGRQALGEIKLK